MSRLLKGLGVLSLIVAFPAFLFAGEKLTILHLNDTHGQIEAIQARDGKTYGGFGRVAYLVDSLRSEAEAEGRTFYFLHAGDALQGPPVSNMSKGKLDFELLNEMGLDAMVVGNHEFDFGQPNLDELVEIAEFPVLSANVVDELNNRPYQVFVEEKAGKERILLVGLTTEATPIGTHPANVEGLSFLPADSVIAALIDSLGYGERDFVIALTHLGLQADSVLAEQVPQIDLIVGGHSHTIIEEPRKIKNSLIVQAGARTVYLGKLEAELKKGSLKGYSYELIPLSGKIAEEPDMAARIAEAGEELNKQLGVPIGKTEIALVPGFTEAADELSLGDLVAEIMREETGAEFAFTNAGGVRAAIIPGDVTMKDVLTALPFSNTVVVMELSAEQVQELLDYNVSLGPHSGGTLHLAVVEYKEVEGKAMDISIGGKPLDPAKTYKIATNNFLAAGGDGYEILKQGQNIYDTGTGVNSLLVRYIEMVGTITRPSDQK